ncbi:hypothetical protein ABPG74_009591 [Tetrahymena malaccensis]
MNLSNKAIILIILFIQLSYGQNFLSMCSSIQGYASCVNTEGCELVESPEMQCFGTCYTLDQTSCSNYKICQWQSGLCANISTCKSLLSESDCSSSKPCYWQNVWVCQNSQKNNGSSYNSILGAVFSIILGFFL